MQIAACSIALMLSACGGSDDKRAALDSITPNKAVFGVPTEFTLKGTNLPIEGAIVFADGECQSPTARSQSAITLLCTSTSAEGQSKFRLDGVPNPGPTLLLTTNLAQPTQGVLISSDGVDSPLSAYSLVADFKETECVYDRTTKLTWEGKTKDGNRSYKHEYTNLGDGSSDDVDTYVDAVNSDKLCGFNDWRIPTFHELMSLVDYSKEAESSIATSRAINPDWFPYTGNTYWTSSPVVTSFQIQNKSRKPYWIVEFIYGQVYSGFTFAEPQSYAVRLVRP